MRTGQPREYKLIIHRQTLDSCVLHVQGDWPLSLRWNTWQLASRKQDQFTSGHRSLLEFNIPTNCGTLTTSWCDSQRTVSKTCTHLTWRMHPTKTGVIQNWSSRSRPKFITTTSAVTDLYASLLLETHLVVLKLLSGVPLFNTPVLGNVYEYHHKSYTAKNY